MKKVKIMLTAIAVVSIVGGALAFKAQNFQPQTVYITSGVDGVCDLQVSQITIPTSQFNNLPKQYVSFQSGPCPLTTTTTVE